MPRSDKAKRDRDFARLVKWFQEADEIAEILFDEFPEKYHKILLGGLRGDPDSTGVHSAYDMLNFLAALAKFPQDYDGEPDSQRDAYPELAFGLMQIARMVGMMKLNDDDATGFGV